MTAAPETLSALPRSAYAAAGARTLRHWERALIVLAVCLPVPVFAATGLSIPLPSTVERLAAALVPWADTASFDENEAATVGADGAIVLAPKELAGAQVAASVAPVSITPVRDEPSGKTDRKQPRKEGGGDGKDGGAATGGGTASGGGDGSAVGSGGGTSTGSGGTGSGGGETSSSSGPLQTVVQETTQATQPIVGAVEETADETVGGVTEVVGGVGKITGGLLPFQGP